MSIVGTATFSSVGAAAGAAGAAAAVEAAGPDAGAGGMGVPERGPHAALTTSASAISVVQLRRMMAPSAAAQPRAPSRPTFGRAANGLGMPPRPDGCQDGAVPIYSGPGSAAARIGRRRPSRVLE